VLEVDDMTSTNEPAGIWVRVSSGKQDEKNQLPDVEAHCKKRGYRIAKRYELNDKSAFKGEQDTKLAEMLADMRDGTIKVLVIWHSDRLERRGGRELINLIAAVRDAGGRIESHLEPNLGNQDFGGQIETFIKGLTAYEESRLKSERVRISHNTIRNNGKLGPGGIPWGYVPSGDKYSKDINPTDQCREIVPQIFERCIAGDSRRSIAQWLDSEGVKPKRGNKWHEGSVGHILDNQTYAGRRQDLDGKTVMRCEPVISPETFKRAQTALKTRPKRGPVKADNRPMLASLKCARCEDSPMFRIKLTNRNGNGYYYYRCTGRGPQRKGCGNMVPFDLANRMVAVRFLLWNDQPYQTRQWIDGTNYESEMLDIEQSIRELNPRSKEDRAKRAELEELLDEYASRPVTLGEYDVKDVLNPDGTVRTIGQHFYGLDSDGRREYLAEHDIRAEKLSDGRIRVVIDGREDSGPTELREMYRQLSELGIRPDGVDELLEAVRAR
jgi:DNA invertase Pin-like site-specific DNA recombinase